MVLGRTVLSRFRNRHYFLGDVLALLGTPLLALLLRFGSPHWTERHLTLVIAYTLPLLVIRLALLAGCQLYRRLWRHASVADFERLILAAALSTVAVLIWGVMFLPMFFAIERFPLSVMLLDSLGFAAALALPRALGRAGISRRPREHDQTRLAVIVGAGAAGKMVAKTLLSKPSADLLPVAFLDDDVEKHGKMLCDHPIAGSIASMPEVIEEFGAHEVIIAIPSAPGTTIRRIVDIAREAGATPRIVPSMMEILSRNASTTAIRDIRIEDLLRREPVRTDLTAVQTLVTGRCVLVTGAGGSIGSELCRQIAQLGPTRLILLGHGENSIFEIQHELLRRLPTLPIVPVIADIRDQARIAQLFAEHRPEIVFHAAAHKHVPLMEGNVVEAVTNNVAGTRHVVDAAGQYGAKHFVLISSDKAVRPTSVMGATKRIAEQIVQMAAARHDINFVAVRFGNVLGSRGSVVPTFLKQIRAGGPVTVTHPEMRRYFMTIPEAVQLVLQAGALGRGGEVFLLDMGEPVRVADLAADLIRLSGLQVGTDIEIRYTGMRPGEKLYEEMFFSSENAVATSHEKILCAKAVDVQVDAAELINEILLEAATVASPDRLRNLIRELVPDFTQGHAPSVLRIARNNPQDGGHSTSHTQPLVQFTSVRPPNDVHHPLDLADRKTRS
jgi:FlaA1/EpsC-like NDP-sugar epimerase